MPNPNMREIEIEKMKKTIEGLDKRIKVKKTAKDVYVSECFKYILENPTKYPDITTSDKALTYCASKFSQKAMEFKRKQNPKANEPKPYDVGQTEFELNLKRCKDNPDLCASMIANESCEKQYGETAEMEVELDDLKACKSGVSDKRESFKRKS
jgi:hypothetical protein